MSNDKKLKIAVVGTGIAGLSCAYLLSQEHEVTVFESADTLGMDSASTTYAGARMDVPLRTFSADYYPNLTALYNQLGVKFAHANYEFACYRHDEETPYFSFFNICRHHVVKKIVGYDSISFPVLVSLNPVSVYRYFSLMTEFYFFQRRGPSDLASGKCANKTFKEYALQNHSEQFYYDLILPMLSVICTCSWEAVGNYPAEIVVDYLAGRARKHPIGSTTLRAISGTQETVKRLSENFRRILTGCRVERVTIARNGQQPTVKWMQNGGNSQTESFDHVVIATQANAALAILDGTPDHAKALSSIKYEKSRTVLHCDESLVPATLKGTCTLIRTENQSDCTIWMNRIDGHLAKDLHKNVYQTWNPLREPKGELIVDAIFERPVMTLKSLEALDLLADLNGQDGVSFVGAYSLYSMPLLENGVRSSIRVANRFLAKPYPELGVQVSGKSFSTRRPDLINHHEYNDMITRKRSASALALDGLVLSSYLAVIVGAASLASLLAYPVFKNRTMFIRND